LSSAGRDFGLSVGREQAARAPCLHLKELTLQEFDMASDQMARTGQTDETDRLISSEKVEGTTVYNRNGESLGSIHHLMIDKFTGQVEYAVMSTGGFLGIGENYSPVPWDSLDYDVNLGGYVMDADRTRLEKAPRFTQNAQPNWSDHSYADRVDEYWQVGRS
jgi:hypothetical protein